ncbi:hypothetical protein KAU08_12010, partial [bacterium]|nr:hypothetical protein [bacterium]
MPIYSMTTDDISTLLVNLHKGDKYIYPFRPLATLTFKLDYVNYGADPSGFHITNILIHSINCLLIFWIALLLGAPPILAALATIGFGVYPAFPEAVVWISGRFDLLALTFMLLSIISWIWSRRHSKYWITLSIILYLLGLFCKETLITGIIIFIAIDVLLLKSNRYIEWLCLTIPVSILLGIRFWFLGSIGDQIARNTQILSSNSIGSLWDNTFIALSPLSRAFFGVDLIYISLVILSALASAAISYAMYQWYRGNTVPRNTAILALLWFILFTIPTILIAPVSIYLVGSRFLYIPIAGISIFLGVMLRNLPVKWQIVLVALIMPVIIFSAFVLNVHNNRWIMVSNHERILEATLDSNCDKFQDGTGIVLVNVPFYIDGIVFRPNGYEAYIDWKYDRKVIIL